MVKHLALCIATMTLRQPFSTPRNLIRRSRQANFLKRLPRTLPNLEGRRLTFADKLCLGPGLDVLVVVVMKK